MSEQRRRRLLLFAASGHLILVALGAAQVDPRPLGHFGQVLDYYGILSGAGNGYGFFSPGVGGQIRAQFDILDREGRQTTTSLDAASNREASLKLRHVFDEFWNSDEHPELRRSLAASLAGKMFARHPQARKVVVRIEFYQPVSMEAFRSGSRPQWEPLYEAKFVVQGRPTADEAK